MRKPVSMTTTLDNYFFSKTAVLKNGNVINFLEVEGGCGVGSACTICMIYICLSVINMVEMHGGVPSPTVCGDGKRLGVPGLIFCIEF